MKAKAKFLIGRSACELCVYMYVSFYLCILAYLKLLKRSSLTFVSTVLSSDLSLAPTKSRNIISMVLADQQCASATSAISEARSGNWCVAYSICIPSILIKKLLSSLALKDSSCRIT